MKPKDEDDSPFNITVCGAASEPEARAMRDAVVHTLRACARDAASIAIQVVDDAQIALLNERHLGHPGPTDCLTFDYRQSGDGSAPIEGDVVVSLDTARRQARARGHTVAAELMLYAIHGTLHLLGYDDRAAGPARAMHALEDRLLVELGVGPVFSREAAGEEAP